MLFGLFSYLSNHSESLSGWRKFIIHPSWPSPEKKVDKKSPVSCAPFCRLMSEFGALAHFLIFEKQQFRIVIVGHKIVYKHGILNFVICSVE